MHLRYFVIIVTLFVIGMACNSNTEPTKQEPVAVEEEQEFELSPAMAQLYQTVMDKHDTAMVLMGPISSLQHQLRGKLSQTQGEENKEILEALSALNKGDEVMRVWMREFKNTIMHAETYRAWSEEEIKAYLEEEERKIEQVDIDMRDGIKLATKAIE